MLSTTGLTLYDRSGRGNYGTLTNMAAASDWVTAKVRGTSGRVLDCDGSNDFVTLQRTVFELPFAVSLWFRSRSATTVQGLFCLGSSASANPLFQVVLRGDLAGDPVAAQMRGSNPTLNSFARIDGYTINTWHHVVAVFRDVSYRQIWLDGVEGTADTTTYDVQALNLATIAALRRTTTTQYVNGQVAECVQWARSINTGEVRALYNLGPGWFGRRSLSVFGYSEQLAAGFRSYWARRKSQLIGGGL